jgi:hypothetical protein
VGKLQIRPLAGESTFTRLEVFKPNPLQSSLLVTEHNLHGILCSVTLRGNHDGWSLALSSVKAHSQAHTTAKFPASYRIVTRHLPQSGTFYAIHTQKFFIDIILPAALWPWS